MKPHATFARRCGRYYIFAVHTPAMAGGATRYEWIGVDSFWGRV